MNMKRKCHAILQLNKKMEIQNFEDGPLQKVTDHINTQFDNLAKMMLQNITSVGKLIWLLNWLISQSNEYFCLNSVSGCDQNNFKG